MKTDVIVVGGGAAGRAGIVAILPAIAFAVLAGLCPPSTAAVAGGGSVNVRDYGTRGDGVTDDTAAIRAAVEAAQMTYSEPAANMGLYIQAGPVLVFPSGRYRITDAIDISGCIEVQGVGRPIITQVDTNRNILVNAYAWRQSIRNLTFEGGKTQIRLTNPNLDTGMLIIDHCRFYGASGWAIENDVTSTTVKINDCVFAYCRRIWDNVRADQAIMRDCWLSPAEMGDYAAIEHHSGMMTLDNIVGVPPAGSRTRRWIDNYAEWLTVRKFRFGGEHAGMTPVYNFRKYTYGVLDHGHYRELGVNIILDDCFIVDNGTRQCAVYCFEMPNLLRVSNSTLCTGIEAVRLRAGIDLATYFSVISPAALSFTVDGTIGSNVRLPEGLAAPVTRAAESVSAEQQPDVPSSGERNK